MARIDDLEKGLVDQFGEQIKAEIGDDGKEYGDPVPKAPPAHLRRSMSMAEQIQQMVRREVSLRADEQGYETFEESDDFDVDDDPPDPHTPYEAHFDPVPPMKENDNGDDTKSASDKGRNQSVGGRSGKSGKVGEGKSGEKQPTPDKGSPSEADDGNSGSEAED